MGRSKNAASRPPSEPAVQRIIDVFASSVTLRTRATGLFARFAHDLEIEARGFSGWVEVEGASTTAELTFPVAQLRVVGVLRAGRVARNVLSSKDVLEIERKVRMEVLVGPTVIVRWSGDLLRGELRVVAPRGEQRLAVAVTVDTKSDSTLVVRGRMRISLNRLGCPEVKAPFGAFKVADDVDVEAVLALGA